MVRVSLDLDLEGLVQMDNEVVTDTAGVESDLSMTHRLGRAPLEEDEREVGGPCECASSAGSLDTGLEHGATMPAAIYADKASLTEHTSSVLELSERELGEPGWQWEDIAAVTNAMDELPSETGCITALGVGHLEGEVNVAHLGSDPSRRDMAR